MRLLHIDTSILGDHSVSRQLSAQMVAAIRSAVPDLTVAYRDLDRSPVPHLSSAFLAAQAASEEQDPALREESAISSEVLHEFLAADVVVIGVAFYNFAIPSQLKAWIDRIMVAGQTFRYDDDGNRQGLAGDKRIIMAIARGGFYGAGTADAAFEHAESYLRTVFSVVGVSNLETVAADGLAVGPEERKFAIEQAQRQIARLAA